MGEPIRRIFGRDGCHRLAHRFEQRLAGAGPESPQEGLDLRERLLDRGEVGGVGGEEEQLALAFGDGRPNALGLVDAQGVQDDHLPWPQGRSEDLLDVALERQRIQRALHGPGRLQPLWGERRHQRGVLAVVTWHLAQRTPVMRRPAVEARQRRVRPAFIHKDELPRISAN